MEKVAIIGMGTSSMAVAAGYAKVADPAAIQITAYDTESSFGKGYPYRQDSDELLLNLKTRKISYDYENNDDLAEWLQENGSPAMNTPHAGASGSIPPHASRRQWRNWAQEK